MFEQETKVSITIEQLQRYLILWSEGFYFIKEHKGLKEYVKKYELNIKPAPKEILNYAINEGFKEDKVEQKQEQFLENLSKKEADKRFTQAKELESKLEKG